MVILSKDEGIGAVRGTGHDDELGVDGDSETTSRSQSAYR